MLLGALDRPHQGNPPPVICVVDASEQPSGINTLHPMRRCRYKRDQCLRIQQKMICLMTIPQWIITESIQNGHINNKTHMLTAEDSAISKFIIWIFPFMESKATWIKHPNTKGRNSFYKLRLKWRLVLVLGRIGTLWSNRSIMELTKIWRLHTLRRCFQLTLSSDPDIHFMHRKTSLKGLWEAQPVLLILPQLRAA